MYYAAQDIIEYLMNSVGGGAQDSEHRLLRAAAHHAYRDVMHARDWNWLSTESVFPAAGSVTLPANVKNVDGLILPDRTNRAVYVTPNEYRRLESGMVESGHPVFWTVMKSEDKPDRWKILVANPSAALTQSGTYYITYRRLPQPLKYMGFEDVCRDGSLTDETAPGAVKRYGTATTHPEGMAGINPHTAEEILGLENSLIGTPPEDAKTVVSDYLDVSPSMFSAVLSGAEVWLAKMAGKNVEGALAVYNRDLRMAFEADTIAPMSGRRSGVGRYPDIDAVSFGTPQALGYYSPSGPDTGG